MENERKETLVMINQIAHYDEETREVKRNFNISVTVDGYSSGILTLPSIEDLKLLKKSIDDFMGT